MLDGSSHLRLADEALAGCLIVHEVRGEHLEGNLATEVGLGGEIDDTHPAAPDDSFDPIRAEVGAAPGVGTLGGHGAMNMRDPSVAPQVKMGPGVATLSPMPMDRTGERPTGLEKVDHRVLTYHDLKSLAPNADTRTPTREIDLHLTANMERYMWSFDGKKYSEAKDPIRFRYGERVRLTFVNDTMMEHPLHLHGMWMHVENGVGEYLPRKHTVIVKPAERLSVAVTADALGPWAFHCHLLFHMDAGMFRVVEVSEP